MNCKISKNDLNYKSTHKKKLTILVNIHCLLFLRDIHEGHLSIEGADNKQSKHANELKNFDKGTKTLDKKSFLK